MSEISENTFSPYPGLRPFRMDEDYLFFGREEQTAELVRLLREHRFLAVVGRSGSGKSSLVRAGLLPSIQGGMMQHASSAWEIAVLRPGGHPIRNLAKCLIDADLYDPDDAEVLPRLVATLNHSALGLVQAYRQSEIEDDANLLIVVDQFEELFRFERNDRKSKDEAHAFVELLLEASAASEVPIYVILTMRSDYLGDCAQVPGLAEAVNRGEYLIPRLERSQLRVAIEGPSKVGGGAVSYRLVQHLLNELGDEEDQLPVLQHALMRTWSFWQDDHADGEEIDLRHYESSGGMKLAISNHADEVFDRLPDEKHRQVAERLFRALTVKGDDNRGVRRPTRLDQLASISREDLEIVKTVIDAYRNPGVTFLMPGVEVDLHEDSVIDLSHESLMRVWQRLRRWVDTEAQSARIYRRLVDTAELHAETKAGLYHNPDLEIALAWREDERPNAAWASQYDEGFDRAIAFLDESQRQAQLSEQHAEQARQRELQQAQALAESRARSAVLLKRFAMAIGTACLIAIALAVWAMQQSKVAHQNARLAERETIRANAEEIKAREAAEESNRLAEQAKRLEAKAVEAATQAKQSLGKTWVTTAGAAAKSGDRFSARIKAARALGFEGHGRQSLDAATQESFPVLLKEGTPEWFEAERLIDAGATSQLMWTSGLRPQHRGDIRDIAKHPNGSMIASVASGERTVHLWDSQTGELKEELPTQSEPRAIAFSPDGEHFVAASNLVEVFTIGDDGVFTLVEGELPETDQTITSLAFSSDGARLALADAQGNLYLWDDWTHYETFPTGEMIIVGIHASARINSIAFHPLDNGILALGGNKNGEVSLIDTNTQDIERLEPIKTHGNDLRVHSLAFSPDGALLAVGGEGIPVTVWDVSSRKPATVLLEDEWNRLTSTETRGSESLILVSPQALFSPDGSQVAVSWYHKSPGNGFLFYPPSLSIYDITEGTDAPVRVTDIATDDGPFSHVCFNHDGKALLLARRDRIQWWDLEAGRPARGLPAAHSDSIKALAFSPDGLLFASGDASGLIRIWDARTGDLLNTFAQHWGPISGLKFSADSSRLFATGDRDRMLSAWEVSSGELIELLEYSNPVVGLDLTPDGRTLLVGGWYNRVFAYDPETLALQAEIKVAHGNTPIVFPDGKQFAVLRNAEESDLIIYDFEDDGTATVVSQWHPLSEAYWDDIDIHPGGEIMTVTLRDRSIVSLRRQPDRTWQPGTERLPRFRDEETTGLEFDRSGRRVFTGTPQGQTKIWEIPSGKLLEVLPGTEPITSLVVSPNGQLLVTGDEDGVLRLWKTPSDREDDPARVVVGTQAAPHPILKGSRSIALAPKRRLLFTTGAEPALSDIIAWNVSGERMTREYVLSGHANQPGAMAISPDERYLISGPAWTPGHLMLWDLDTGESRRLSEVGPPSVLVFSPDGKTVAGSFISGGEENPQPVCLWDIAKGGDPVAQTPLLPGPAMGLAFTPDGEQLISVASREGHPIQFWDIDPQTRALSLSQELSTSSNHRPFQLALSHDGSRLAVAFGAQGGQIWDLTTPTPTRSETITGGLLYSAAFSLNDEFLAVGGLQNYLGIQESQSRQEWIRFGNDGGLWDVITDLAFDSDGQTLFVSRTDGSVARLPIADASVSPAAYVRSLDLEEASGDLVWIDRNVTLSPPTEANAFVSFKDHYLAALGEQSDPLAQRVRLFEIYLQEDNFPAAEDVLLSIPPDVSEALREKLVVELADRLIDSDSNEPPLETNLEMAQRLFEAYSDLFAVRLALCVELNRWNEAEELLTQELKHLTVIEKTRYVRRLFDAMESQVEHLSEEVSSLDENDPAVPSRTLLFALTLDHLLQSLGNSINADRLLGFYADVSKPLAENLLDQLWSDTWKTESILATTLETFREIDDDHSVFPWLDVFEEGLEPDADEAERLYWLRARILEHLGLYEGALAAANARLEVLAGDHSAAGVRESKTWLYWKRKLLGKTEATAKEVDEVRAQLASIPVRPTGLDPKMIDLTDFYSQNLYEESFDLGRLPESFQPRHGVDFDLRGVIRLRSDWYPVAPEKVEGIPVAQHCEAIHFLLGAMRGHDSDRIEVAEIIVHFEDGTTSNMVLRNKDHVADWLQWLENYRLRPDQKGWSGRTHNPWIEEGKVGTLDCALSEVIWTNPYPDKMVNHLDLVSRNSNIAPWVIAITLE